MTAPMSASAGPARTIALVEDDEQIRALVEKVLTSEGFRVVSTGDPREALDLVRRETPDLVLCDIAMPGMDGYAVLKALQSDPATAGYPVVFITAHQEFSERVRAFRYGVVDYLTKPFNREILLRKIARILEGLGLRHGAPARAQAPAGQLLEEVRREARTGVLTVDGPAGAHRVVLKAGDIVESTAPAETLGAGTARFTALDVEHEDIVTHDPPRLPHTPGQALPTFDDIPPVLRQVLVADDNPLFRRFLAEVLIARGFTVHEAADGEEALRLALEKRPWLILTDVRMPGEDGFTLCEKVRSHTLIRQTPLLFLSGWDDYKARYHGLELGADDFLSKDTSIRELLLRVQLALKRHTASGLPGRGAVMEGELQVMGAPAVLQVCHLTRLTGTLAVVAGARRTSVRFRDGDIVGADGDGRRGEEAVHDLLSWEQGRFQFAPGDPGPGAPLGQTFDQLILEGCRRLDESRLPAGEGPA
jgi:DNA-binding response OmpR family regulator